MPLPLTPRETRLHEARGRHLTVWITNHRVIPKSSRMGREDATSLPLEKIDSMEQVYTSRPLFAIVGVILAVAGVLFAYGGTQMGSNDDRTVMFRIAMGLIAVGIINLIIWVLTRQRRILIKTQQSSITMESGGLRVMTVEQFLTAAEAARQERMSYLLGSQPALSGDGGAGQTLPPGPP